MWQNVEAFAGAVLYNRKVHSFIFCQESFRSAVRDMAQKDTRHFESVKFKWLKRMARECIIITWKGATSLHGALQLAKKSQIPALERM